MEELKEVLPPGMFKRGDVYYVKKMINGHVEKRSTGKRDFKSALRRYHEIMKAWNDGASGWEKTEVPTFEDYWTEHYRPAYTVRKTPLKNTDPLKPEYRDDQLIGPALLAFGRKPLDQITKTLCQKFANSRRRSHYNIVNKAGKIVKSKPYAEGTITRELSFLQAVFQQAIEDGFIEKNPFRGVDREAFATRERTLSPAEQDLLLAQLTPRYQRWLLFMLGTGLRLEEARGIDPEMDLDLTRRSVRVTRKTRGLRKKVQEVPLFDDDVVEVLKEQLEAEGRLWPQNQQRFREVLMEAAQRAGIEHVSPHTLRHTFATRYLQAGGDIYKLSLILGHSSVSITEKVYAHLLQDDLLKASAGIRLGLKRGVVGKVLGFPQASNA